jgi:glycosyltransferase 2 family protein
LKLRIAIFAALGASLALYLLTVIGWTSVLATVAAVGWSGFAALCCYALGLLVLLGSACYVLLPRSDGWTLSTLVWSRMVRDSASEVLPFSQLGGLVLGARATILRGVTKPRAFASLIVDVTAEMLAQIAYVAMGLAIFIAQVPRSALVTSWVTAILIGLGLATLAGGLLLTLPRYGDWIIGKLAARVLPDAAAATTAVAQTLKAIYRSRLRFGLSVILHFAAWIASAVGAWIAFRLAGAHVDLVSVLAIESLIAAARGVAVVIPNALGVQEAAYAVVAPLFGVGAEFGLAVSLLKRARDIAIGVPILLIWQGMEGQRILRRAPR